MLCEVDDNYLVFSTSGVYLRSFSKIEMVFLIPVDLGVPGSKKIPMQTITLAWNEVEKVTKEKGNSTKHHLVSTSDVVLSNIIADASIPIVRCSVTFLSLRICDLLTDHIDRV